MADGQAFRSFKSILNITIVAMQCRADLINFSSVLINEYLYGYDFY